MTGIDHLGWRKPDPDGGRLITVAGSVKITMDPVLYRLPGVRVWLRAVVF